MSDYGPSIRVCNLSRRTSKNGKTYFTGPSGSVRYSVVKSKQTTDDGTEIWSLLMSEAPRQESKPAPEGDRPAKPATRHSDVGIDDYASVTSDDVPF